jgi:hypothetical protein
VITRRVQPRLEARYTPRAATTMMEDAPAKLLEGIKEVEAGLCDVLASE